MEVVAPDRVPTQAEAQDFGDAAILPGLVDSHVHINDPGRAEWEGFTTATRAAAAGGYTMLVDMPLNCLPATTNVAALEAKRKAAQGRCRWIGWRGEELSRITRATSSRFRSRECPALSASSYIPGLMVSRWLRSSSCALLCPMLRGVDCHYWCTRNFLVQSIRPRRAWRMRIGPSIRRICNRGPKKRNCRRFVCCCRFAANTNSACTLSISRPARRLPSCAPHAPRVCR